MATVLEVKKPGALKVVLDKDVDITMRDGTLTGMGPDDARKTLAPDTVVSLNCWGLLPDLLPDLEEGLRKFLAHAGAKDEYFLPHAIAAHLAKQRQPLSVLPCGDTWLGLTYPDDRSRVTGEIAALHAQGVYPTPLWIQA